MSETVSAGGTPAASAPEAAPKPAPQIPQYYPLLARAVANLPNATHESRHAVYDRARRALIGQLTSIKPPVAQVDIDRESQALDEAIALIETETAEATASAALARAESSAAPTDEAPPPPPPVAAPAPSRAAFRVPARSGFSPPPQRPTIPAAATGALATAAAIDGLRDRSTTAAATPAPEIRADVAPEPAVPADSLAATAANDRVVPGDMSAVSIDQRSDSGRPAAPLVRAGKRRNLRPWILAAAIGLVVALVGVAAYALRDRPETLTKLRPPPGTEQKQEPPSKIVERVGGAPRDPTTAPAAGTPQTAPPPQPAIGVSHRAALLLEAPEEQNRVKTYLGNAVWRLDTVNGGDNLPAQPVVRADIDIPEAGFKAVMTLQKNTDASLSASHVLRLRFTFAAGSALGGVKEISMPQLRLGRDDTPTGDPLTGVQVMIVENTYLVGLSRSDNDKARNLDLMVSRPWIDVPMLLTTGRVAKLTFEKGTSGDRVIADAFSVWGK